MTSSNHKQLRIFSDIASEWFREYGAAFPNDDELHFQMRLWRMFKDMKIPRHNGICIVSLRESTPRPSAQFDMVELDVAVRPLLEDALNRIDRMPTERALLKEQERIAFLAAGLFFKAGFDGKEPGLKAKLMRAMQDVCDRQGFGRPAASTAGDWARFAVEHCIPTMQRQATDLGTVAKQELEPKE